MAQPRDRIKTSLDGVVIISQYLTAAMATRICKREEVTMKQIRLTEGTSIVLTETMVDLIKEKGHEHFRVTCIPRTVVELSFLHGSAFDKLTGVEKEEICIANFDEWMLSVTTFRQRRYMCYTRIDKQGNKLR